MINLKRSTRRVNVVICTSTRLPALHIRMIFSSLVPPTLTASLGGCLLNSTHVHDTTQGTQGSMHRGTTPTRGSYYLCLITTCAAWYRRGRRPYTLHIPRKSFRSTFTHAGVFGYIDTWQVIYKAMDADLAPSTPATSAVVGVSILKPTLMHAHFDDAPTPPSTP